MTPERHQQLGELYHEALELEPESRATFLEEACGGDEVLRQEIESLLAAHDKVGNYFASPVMGVGARLVAQQQNPSLMGEMMGHYRVLTLIGAGGMGQVYLSEDTRLGRKVALKLLPREFTEDAERVRRFEQEARAASSLNHPNIVTIYEVGQVDGRHFIATEYIEGQTLREQLAGAQMEAGEALELAVQIASALEAAHEAGIVHRDIKPENVMVRRDGLVKVVDFGLAKLSERRDRRVGPEATTDVDTTPGLVLGTVAYMSPEQAKGERLDQRTDLFSLGVVIYEMVAGRSPFAASSLTETLVAILEREPKRLREIAENVPADLERIVNKALRKEREGRYESAREMLSDLREVKQEIELKTRLGRRFRTEKTVRETVVEAARVSDEQVAVDKDGKPAHTTIGGEHIVSETRRHKLWVAISAAVLMAVVALAYYIYPTSGETIDSIAVLPFENVGNDPNTEYLSDGISDSIINSLSQLPGLKRVIALNSTLRYKGQQVDPQAVGREFNVQAVLMGRPS